MKNTDIESKRKREKKNESILENLFYASLSAFYYFYFVTSSIALIGYFTNHMNLFNIFTIIIIIGIVIDFLLGFTRNIFGTIGLIVSSIIGVYLIKDIKTGIFLGISVCSFISSVLNIIINKIFFFLVKKFS